MKTCFLKVFSGVWVTLMVTGAARAQTGERNATVANNLSIGEKAWPPVSNGVVFVDGKYVSPPYVISRREGEIFLNGVHFDWVIQWPPKKGTPLPPPAEMPSMPNTITEKTTKYDKDYLTYINDAQQFLMAKYGTNSGIAMMDSVYLKMPCIQSAKFKEEASNTLEVVWINGSHSNIRLTPMPRGEMNITKEQAAAYIDKIAEIYVRGLGENCYYYVMGKGDRRQGTFGGFQGTFGLYARALQASKDEADFLAIMKTNQPTGGISAEWLKLFYSHKDDLPKWAPLIQQKEK